MRVQLPAGTDRQILETEAGEKGKRFLFKCCTSWENGRLLSESPSPPGNPEENSADLSQTKNQRQSPEFLIPFKVLSFGNHRQSLRGHPGNSASLPATVSAQVPSWNSCVGPVLSLAMLLLGSEGLMNTLAVHLPGGEECISSFPCCHSFILAHLPAFPWSHPQSGTGRGQEGFSPYPMICLALLALTTKLPPASILPGGVYMPPGARTLCTRGRAFTRQSWVTWTLQPHPLLRAV